MEIHHSKHHQAYVNNLNKLLAESNQKVGTLESILSEISKYGTGIRNNAGGHYNHSLFWNLMSPSQTVHANPALSKAIETQFISIDNFKSQFTTKAMSIFGSGWVWLIVQNKSLVLTTTANQDNPLMEVVEQKGIPILALDVWEHAYYLKYQNRRADYLMNWWNVVNWTEVEKRYLNAIK